MKRLLALLLLLTPMGLFLSTGKEAQSDVLGFCTPRPCFCMNGVNGEGQAISCWTDGEFGWCQPIQSTGCVQQSWTCNGTQHVFGCGQGGVSLGLPCSVTKINGCRPPP